MSGGGVGAADAGEGAGEGAGGGAGEGAVVALGGGEGGLALPGFCGCAPALGAAAIALIPTSSAAIEDRWIRMQAQYRLDHSR